MDIEEYTEKQKRLLTEAQVVYDDLGDPRTTREKKWYKLYILVFNCLMYSIEHHKTLVTVLATKKLELDNKEVELERKMLELDKIRFNMSKPSRN